MNAIDIFVKTEEEEEKLKILYSGSASNQGGQFKFKLNKTATDIQAMHNSAMHWGTK